MKIISFVIFCIVLFIYLHVQFHLKTSDELEIYEIEQASKDKLEQICDIRQPVIFMMDDDDDKIVKTTNKSYLLNNFPAFDVKIRDSVNNPETELYLPLQFKIADKLFQKDTTGVYFSENNMDFLQETGVIKNLQYNDGFLRPSLMSNSSYDILLGSTNVTTPLRYEINYRNYFMVTQGSITIKLTPPRSIKYLYSSADYENFEFISPVDVWNCQPRYQADFDKIRTLEVTLTVGKLIYIPAYWFYSIKFNTETSVSCFKYRSYMNNLAICPHIIMYCLQQRNINRKNLKKIDLFIDAKKNEKQEKNEKDEKEKDEKEEKE